MFDLSGKVFDKKKCFSPKVTSCTDSAETNKRLPTKQEFKLSCQNGSLETCALFSVTV